MINILNKHIAKLVALSVVLLIVSVVSLVKVDYTLTAPGYNAEVSRFISIESSYDQEGSFHTTSVIVVRRMSYLQYWLSQSEDTVQVKEIPEYYQYVDDLSDLTVMGYQMKDDSLANSLVVGFENSGHEIDYEVNDVVYLIYSYMDENTLEIGDSVVSINGNNPYTEPANVNCNETATFEIIRDEEELTFTMTKNYYTETLCAFGVYIDPLTEVTSSDVEYKLHHDFSTGPSGGLMQSMYIYNVLTPNDITGGLKIAGTGTIDSAGNVGSIGGIEQKIITSSLNGIDLFFVPHLTDLETDNYIVALSVLEKLDTDMKLVPVRNFTNAISYLEQRYGGAFDE